MTRILTICAPGKNSEVQAARLSHSADTLGLTLAKTTMLLELHERSRKQRLSHVGEHSVMVTRAGEGRRAELSIQHKLADLVLFPLLKSEPPALFKILRSPSLHGTVSFAGASPTGCEGDDEIACNEFRGVSWPLSGQGNHTCHLLVLNAHQLETRWLPELPIMRPPRLLLLLAVRMALRPSKWTVRPWA